MENSKLEKLLSAIEGVFQAEKKPDPSKIALITVCHNQLSHTKRLLESLRRFTVNPLQIIIVNNASTDGTLEWLRDQDNICALNEPENLGWVGGINHALDYVDIDSEYVVFANNDVVVCEDWDLKLLSHFDSTVGAVGPTSNYVSGRQNRIFDHAGINEEEQNFLIGFFMCVKHSVIEEVGPLDDLHSFRTEKDEVVSGGDDIDYSIRIRNLGYRCVIARDCFVYHAGSQSLKKALTDQEYFDLCNNANEAIKRKHGENIFEELISNPVKVLCAVPMRSDFLHRKFAFTFSTMSKPFHFECADIPRAHIESARIAAVKFAQERQFTHILFLDDDHIIPSDLFTRLYSMNKPVAAALAFKRIAPYEPVIGNFGLTDEGKTWVVIRPDLIKTGIQKIDATGFAAVLIRMEVFDVLTENKLDWFKWGELGEDFSFCLSCKEAGIEICCDTDLILPHIGENLTIDEEVYYSFNPQMKKTV